MQANWEHRLIELAGNAPKPAASPFFSYWAGDLALQKAYARCAAITAQHSKSFYLASSFLPEEKRAAVRALYAFCRTVDDIVDGSSNGGATWAWTTGVRKSRLNLLRRMIRLPRRGVIRCSATIFPVTMPCS